MRQLTIGIGELRDMLSHMGSLVDLAVSRAIRGVLDRDMELVEQVLQCEESINRLEMEIDNHAIVLLARHQPVACDLRFIATVMKMNTDLERIGDLAANIARRAIDLAQEPRTLALCENVRRMAASVTSMVSRSIQAFLDRDVRRAEQILADDDEVDRFLSSITRELFHEMSRDSSSMEVGLELMFVARNLERIADHATNIAEAVVFLIHGIDVRHNARQVA